MRCEGRSIAFGMELWPILKHRHGGGQGGGFLGFRELEATPSATGDAMVDR